MTTTTTNFSLLNTTVANHTNGSEEIAYDFGHSLSQEFVTVISIYFILLTAGGVVFNIILIHAICTTHKLYSVSNVLIVNLAICDLITAVTGIPLDTDFLLRGYYDQGLFLCGLKETTFMLSLPSSVACLLLLTSERYVKIIHTFKHHEIFTKLKVILLLVMLWTYCVIVALFPILYDNRATVVHYGKCWVSITTAYAIYQVVVNFAVPLICIMFMNIAIFRFASAHAKQIYRQRTSVRSVVDESSQFAQSRASIKRESRRFRTNFKAAKTIMALSGMFLFCWLTYIILVISNILCGICHPRELTWGGNAINFTSVAVNPLLYGLLDRNIRDTLKKNYMCRQSTSYISSRYSERTTGLKAVLRSRYKNISLPPKCKSLSVSEATEATTAKSV